MISSHLWSALPARAAAAAAGARHGGRQHGGRAPLLLSLHAFIYGFALATQGVLVSPLEAPSNYSGSTV